jgi:hypothetical protein
MGGDTCNELTPSNYQLPPIDKQGNNWISNGYHHINRSAIKAARIPKNHKIEMHLQAVWFGSRFMKQNSSASK